jgi:hypothetical protein
MSRIPKIGLSGLTKRRLGVASEKGQPKHEVTHVLVKAPSRHLHAVPRLRLHRAYTQLSLDLRLHPRTDLRRTAASRRLSAISRRLPFVPASGLPSGVLPASQTLPDVSRTRLCGWLRGHLRWLANRCPAATAPRDPIPSPRARPSGRPVPSLRTSLSRAA